MLLNSAIYLTLINFVFCKIHIRNVMKRAIKKADSEILKKKMHYRSGDSKTNRQLRLILETEQSNYCAYTEYRITAGFATDVEHFNPTLKNTPNDNYYNWYAVSHKWNNTKARKWAEFQPILHPTAHDFEQRLLFDPDEAIYFANPADVEAKNLINLLELNNYRLAKERKQHIKLLKVLFEETNKALFLQWLTDSPDKQPLIEFKRAIEVTFNINL